MVQDNANLTPEKQLLKLIEEPHSRFSKNAVMRGKGATFFSFGGLRGRFNFLKETLASFLRSWSGPIDTKKINAILTFISIVVGAYFIGTSVFLALKLSVLPVFSFKTESTAKSGALKQVSQLKALTFYMEKVRTRDIFKLGAKEPAQATPQQPGTTTAKQAEVLSKYKLVGISWSDNPDAMIEDSAVNKTYFLKRGQSLDGVKVQAIFKDKVVLSYQGVEAELR
ncbi:MAG: hypothetical protein AAB213_04805 [Candidatus Omnitrophota bacterium]